MCPNEAEGLRPPTATETNLLQRLLSADFQGAEGLVRQLEPTIKH